MSFDRKNGSVYFAVVAQILMSANSVWEKNENALRFYKKKGLYEIGTHTFVMGEDKQTDYILRKDLES